MYVAPTGSHPQGVAQTGDETDLDVIVAALPQNLPLLRETARSFAAARGVPRTEDVRLAVSEACTNVIVHAYGREDPGPVRLHGIASPGRVTLVVEDCGAGMRPAPMRAGLGIGLTVIARVADHFSVTDAERGGTRVEMVFSTRG